MTDEIKVYVVDRGRTNLYLRFTDPQTNKVEERSAKTSKQGEAEKAAGKWEAELREGRYQRSSRMSWEAFREYFVTHKLPDIKASSRPTYLATLNMFQRICNPKKLGDVTTARVTLFATELRNKGRADATINRHLEHLQAILNWAKKQELLTLLPKFSMPSRVKGSKVMRGRAPTTEEFERMLSAVPKVVENAAAKSWKFYLRGLWLSGLRLSESLTLRWDDSPECLVVRLDGRRPMFWIPSETEKGNQNRILPMAPEFAELLQAVPQRQRKGRVFKLLDIDGSLLDVNRTNVGKLVSAIGESAKVVVDERIKNGKTVRKFASAHDLRRAFGFRWSLRVMPVVLKELMRHTDINTTMRYYVGQNAEATADAAWEAYSTSSGIEKGDTLGDTPLPSKKPKSKNT